ncbi:MAG: glycosyltransferase family 39 protein, partial [bacterium]
LKIPAFFNDEAIYLHWAARMGAQPSSWLHSLEGGKYPVFIWLLALSMKIFPDPLVAGRLVAVLSGLCALAGLFALGRLLSDVPTALGAAALYLIFPLVVVHDRLALFDTPLNAFSLWGLALTLWIYRDGNFSKGSLAMLAVVCAAAFSMKITGLESAFFAFFAALLYATGGNRRRYVLSAIFVCVLPLVIFLGFSILSRWAGVTDRGVALLHFFVAGPGSSPLFSNMLWIKNGILFFEWVMAYFGLIPVVLVVIGFGRMLKRRGWKDVSLLALWLLVPAIFYLVFGAIVFARYLIPCATPLLIPMMGGVFVVGGGVKRWCARFSQKRALNYGLSGAVLILCFYSYLKFSALALSAPARVPYALLDRWQYVSGWPAGTYFPNLLEFVRRESRKGPCNIIANDHIGLLPDGLAVYAPADGSWKCTVIRDWTMESIRAGASPDRRNFVAVDMYIYAPDARALVQSPPPGLKLIADFTNPGPAPDKCWVFLLQEHK